MNIVHYYFILFFILLHGLFAQNSSDWKADIGFRYFKYSANSTPAEIQYNPVFTRWERINQNIDDYTVTKYEALKPLYFNMSFGIDLFIRYKKHWLIKFGYDYSNPFGMGGNGNITYLDKAKGLQNVETKKFSYTSHQINYFFGPLLQLDNNGTEIYIAFSPMPPTWVVYKEHYSHTENGSVIKSYDKTFKGFFGSCQALFGAQVSISEKFRFGSEAVFTFLNYMKLKSGELEDNSFQFPDMKWNFSIRYEIF
jgi:hypothetical protein